MAGPARYTVGVDFGTLSGRAVVVRVEDGEQAGSAVCEYPSGVITDRLPAARDRDRLDRLDRDRPGQDRPGRGAPGAQDLPADWALQDPRDWVTVLAQAVPEAVRASGIDPAAVIGIGTDFTACTVLPVTGNGTPLCELPQWRSRPHAWAKLWKHHAAQPQADRITALAHERGEPWIARYGGRISAEWQFAKALQLLEEDPEVYAAAQRWIEAADWIIWQLTGRETRNACTAGYKGIYQDGRYPSADYLAALNPAFADFAATRLGHTLSQLGTPAGQLTVAASRLTGLPPGITVAVGNVDAHVTAPAAGAVAPGSMLAVMGTSTCHVMPSTVLAEVPGMCGVVDGGIIAGLQGYEAGQSGVGDIFAWWAENFAPAACTAAAAAAGLSIHDYLGGLTQHLPPGGHGLIALDWMNGNRSVLVDHELSGVIAGLTLATRPEHVYRALLEATAFGTRRIIEAFEQASVPVSDLTVAGGLASSPLLMQVYADVTGRALNVAQSAQGPALGSAIHAAVAAGAYPDVPAAATAMGRVRRGAFCPEPARQQAYTELYNEYLLLHDYLGRPGGSDVLHRLRRIRNRAAAGQRRVPPQAPPAENEVLNGRPASADH